MPDAFEKMDRMYRLQRYFYDATRKYYLLGRDQLLAEMDIRPGERVLEVGCGTGRNLIILERRHPQAHFYGLDASAAMLETAKTKIARAGSTEISLKTALADDFSFEKTFGLNEGFDKIFFSYSISMIASWRESIDNAFKNLRKGGSLYLVDFYDQKELPISFARLLNWWLKKFHVQFWNDLIPYLEELQDQGKASLTLTPHFRRYAFTARLQRTP